ncbi:MAG TPA: ABC transporter substrate-binding protein [Solirubrobacteraceae bacterium]|nr:ABC transporter substrate-binding protein [Solirubrobacteraceae bacterium]
MLRGSRIAAPCLAALAAVTLSACGSPKKTAAAPAASANTCTKPKLPLHTPGVLTVATDSPAYPPYFENNKPANGKGFESAVAYAVAAKLGFTPGEVKWVVEPFDSSYAPGPKSFDFDINEISITKPRAEAVDFSTPYYTNPQGIIVAANGSYAHATSLAAFKNASIGVQIGTTSLAAVTAEINPSHQPDVFNTSNDVVEAFKIHRVDAIVVDLATAFDLTSTELSHTTIAGQFQAPGGDNWGLLLTKGSGLTPCVDKAVNELRADGTLAALNKRWIASEASVPVLH